MSNFNDDYGADKLERKAAALRLMDEIRMALNNQYADPMPLKNSAGEPLGYLNVRFIETHTHRGYTFESDLLIAPVFDTTYLYEWQ